MKCRTVTRSHSKLPFEDSKMIEDGEIVMARADYQVKFLSFIENSSIYISAFFLSQKIE